MHERGRFFHTWLVSLWTSLLHSCESVRGGGLSERRCFVGRKGSVGARLGALLVFLKLLRFVPSVSI
jgi:hypothetical protein